MLARKATDFNKISENYATIGQMVECFLADIYLLTQSQQLKHQNNVWNLLKVNSLSGVIIFNFEQVSHTVLMFPLLTLNK